MKTTTRRHSLALVLALLSLPAGCDWFSTTPIPADGDVDDPEIPDFVIDTDASDTDVEPDGSLMRLITGSVIEDVDGDGDPADGAPAGSVDVSIFRDGGDGLPDGSDDGLVHARVTGTDGSFDFSIEDNGLYWVVVSAASIRPSAGFNEGYGPDDAWAEQTFGPAGALCSDGAGGSTERTGPGPCFGGRRGGRADDPSTLFGAEHVVRAAVSGFDLTGLDLGFSFNVVTDTADSEGEPGSNRSVQGTLRQFITNANALWGDNVMRFVPAVDVQAEGTQGRWWKIAVASPLPSVSDAGTTLDATAYSIAGGTSVIDSNHGAMGTGGTVGVSAAAFSRILRPELEVVGVGAVAHGFRVSGDRTVIQYFSMHHFGTESTDGIVVIEGTSDAVILGNVLGLSPDVFEEPAEEEMSLASCILAVDSASVTVEGNIIAYCGLSGIWVDGLSTGWRVTANEIRGNGINRPLKDGIDLIECTGGMEVSGNLIAANSGCGLDTWQSGGGHTVTGNTIEENGQGGAEPIGVKLFGTGSSLSGNVIRNNAGAGILVVGESTDLAFAPGLSNILSMNHFDGNGGPAIDLTADGEGSDGITTNSGDIFDPCGYTSSMGNAGLDFPVLDSAVLNATGTTLDVSGSACPSSTVELYRAQPGAGDSLGTQSFGEGVEFLGEVSTGDSGEFLGSLSVRLNTGDRVTALSIDAEGNTSEFCANVVVER